MSCVLRSGGPGRPDPQGPPEGLPPQGPPKVPPQVRRRSAAGPPPHGPPQGPGQGHVSGHKWASRSSVITQLNRGRSSQSLDAQEPQDGARDDGTIHLLKRIRRGEEGLDTLGGHRTGHIRTLQSISHISRSQRLTVTRFGPP